MQLELTAARLATLTLAAGNLLVVTAEGPDAVLAALGAAVIGRVALGSGPKGAVTVDAHHTRVLDAAAAVHDRLTRLGYSVQTKVAA